MAGLLDKHLLKAQPKQFVVKLASIIDFGIDGILISHRNSV